jgi:hypothetical protein
MIVDCSQSNVTFESTGREVYAHGGIIGLSPNLTQVSEGYDGNIETYYSDPEFGEAPLTAEERRELADYMKALWERYAIEGLKEP